MGSYLLNSRLQVRVLPGAPQTTLPQLKPHRTALRQEAEQAVDPGTAPIQQITCACGSGIERGDLPTLNGSFRRTLRAEDKSERTVKSYTEAVRLFADFLAQRRHPLTIDAITQDDVRAFVADQLERWKPLTALNRYRGLQAFFKWAVAEGSWTPARWPA
jgi:hypothetical protein